MNLQKGDIYKTHANIGKLFRYTKFKPKVNITKGIKNFISWYGKFYTK